MTTDNAITPPAPAAVATPPAGSPPAGTPPVSGGNTPPSEGVQNPPAPVTPPAPGAVVPPSGDGKAPPVLGADGKPVSPAVTPPAELSWSDQIALIAGDDKKMAAELGRYASQKDMAAALVAAKEKIRSGQLRTPYPKDGTDEQKVEWRSDNGIPATPADVDLKDFKTPDGQPIPDADKPYIEAAVQRLHGANLNADQIKEVLSLSYAIDQQRIDDLHKADVTMEGVHDAQLRKEWGAEFTKNKNIVENFLKGVPDVLRDRLSKGRLADGSPIFTDAESVKYFANLARELNPIGTVTSGTGMDQIVNVDTQIKAYEDRMRTDRTGWHKDMKSQAHYRELLDFRIRQTGKAK